MALRVLAKWQNGKIYWWRILANPNTPNTYLESILLIRTYHYHGHA